MRVLGKDGYLPGVALFFELNDTQLETVRNNKDYIYNKEFVIECIKEKGDNAHLFGLYSDRAERLPDIQRNLKMLLETYKSVSWWNREENKFFYKQRS